MGFQSNLVKKAKSYLPLYVRLQAYFFFYTMNQYICLLIPSSKPFSFKCKKNGRSLKKNTTINVRLKVVRGAMNCSVYLDSLVVSATALSIIKTIFWTIPRSYPTSLRSSPSFSSLLPCLSCIQVSSLTARPPKPEYPLYGTRERNPSNRTSLKQTKLKLNLVL